MMKKITRIKIGADAYRGGGNDYFGKKGTVYIYWDWFNTHKRIQFDNVGNNERLANFNLYLCDIYYIDAPTED